MRVGIEVTPPEIERLFESGTSLHVDDGTRTTAERKKRFQMAQWINPDRAEMFFAQRVVFVEGETEPVLIPFLADKLGRLDPEVSVIDCGSKHNLPLYVAIAEAFRIPHVVIHDEAPLPDPKRAKRWPRWTTSKVSTCRACRSAWWTSSSTPTGAGAKSNDALPAGNGAMTVTARAFRKPDRRVLH